MQQQPNASTIEAKLVPVGHACKELSVGRGTLKRLVAEGRLTGVVLGYRTSHVTRESLDRLISGQS